MILTTTTQKLQIKLSAAIATNNCPIVTDYVDFTSTDTTPGMTPTNTNGTTTVDFLAAPAASTQRKVNSINIFNADTKATVVQIIYNDNATTYDILTAVTVPIGGTLQYTDRNGWEVITTTGGLGIVSLNSRVQEFTANGTWVKPTNCRYFLVDCVGGGGGGGAWYTTTTSGQYGGGGGGGGKRNRMIFLASDLPSTVSVTVGAATNEAAIGNDGSVGNNSSFGSYLVGYGGGGGSVGYSSTSSACAGGGGGGGTSVGGSANFSATGGVGGSAMLAGNNTASVATHQGGGGASTTSTSNQYSGYSSFLGGGGGGFGVADSANNPTYGAGGSSFFSAGGGGGGSYTANVGGRGGATGYGPVRQATTTRGAQGYGPGGGGGGGGGGFNEKTGGAGQAGVVRVWGW